MKPNTKSRKVTKGIKKTSDYIDYDKALLKGRELLWNEKHVVIGFYIIFSINTGLRVGDVLQLKHSELANLKQGDYLIIREQKTGKARKIQINDKVADAYKYLSDKLRSKGLYRFDDFIFKSQKNSVFATVSLNRILKNEFAGYAQNLSTHSLRKSFGRRVYDSNNKSEHALILLSDMFCHASIAMTRRYLGLRQEEIDGVYMAL
jgi:integrase